MKYSNCTILQWSNEKNKVALSNSLTYRLCSAIISLTYLILAAGITTGLIINYNFNGNEEENGKQEIFDVSSSQESQSKQSLIYIIHTMYVGIVTLLVGCWIRLLQTRDHFVDTINKTFVNVLKFQGKCSLFLKKARSLQCIHMLLLFYLEKYMQHTKRSLECQTSALRSTWILFGLAISTFLVPFLFPLMFLQPALPEHRFFEEILEIPISLNANYTRMIPLSVILAYHVFNLADLVFCIDFFAILHFQCAFVWTSFLEPVSASMVDPTKRDDQQLKFKCKLGCTLSENEIIGFYREQQLLCNFFNQFTGNILITIHHAATLLLSTFGCYFCIRHPERLLELGYQLAPAAFVFATILEYIEAWSNMTVFEGSRRFIKSLTKISGMLTKKANIRKMMQKYVRTFRPLLGEGAYPFYQLDKENFLKFQNQVVDLLVSILVSIG